MAFQFSATKDEIRSILVSNEPYFIAKDVCEVLDLKNSRKATSSLDADEKADVTISYTSSNGITQKRKMKAINESGLYNLIFQSRKPEAKAFRKWVTSEVLPSIRKKGYYNTSKDSSNFTDARNIPYVSVLINEQAVRCIDIDGISWFSINDYHAAIGSRTDATQTAKKLNAIETLAKKIKIFGNTHAAWFTTELGLKLIASGSRVLNTKQLSLEL